MSENTLRQIFGRNFSSSAFKTVDGEYRIVGRYGEITLNDDGSFDCWLVSKDRSPLSARFVNARTSKVAARWTILTGEAHHCTTETELVLETAVLLGVKKRKQYSDVQLQAMRERAKDNLQ